MHAPAISTLDEYTSDMIVQSVSAHFQVSVAKLKSREKTQHVVFVRQLAMYLSRESTGLSFPAIGDLFRRDHSTVMYACRVIDQRMAKDPPFRLMIERLKSECNGGAQ